MFFALLGSVNIGVHEMAERSSAADYDQLIGARLRLIRLDRGLTQQVLADAIGVSFQQIQKYETGGNRISASTLVEFCRSLQVEISEFFVDIEFDPQARFSGTALPMDNPEVKSVAKAFARIEDQETRQRIRRLVESLAGKI